MADYRIFAVERSTAAVRPSTARSTRSIEFSRPIGCRSFRSRAGDAVMVRQFRHGAQRVTLEMPAGLVDPGRGSRRRGAARVPRGNGLSRARGGAARRVATESGAVREPSAYVLADGRRANRGDCEHWHERTDGGAGPAARASGNAAQRRDRPCANCRGSVALPPRASAALILRPSHSCRVAQPVLR